MEGRELDPIRFKAYPNEILDCYASDNGVTTETKIADKLDRIIDNTGQILTRLDVVLRQMYELSEYTYGPCIQYMITVFKAFGVAASFIVPQLADVQQIPIPDILKDGNFWKDFATKMDGINEAVSQIMIKTTDLTMHQECYQAYEGADLRQPEKHLKRTDDCRTLGNLYRTTTDEGHVRWPQFGFLFDIDGVLTRGRKLLPYTREAFRKLVDFSGNFRIPTVFVTNAGNELRSSKATKLSHILGIQILPEQVIMSHSPLKLYTEFHKKHCLITGQGPIAEIAKNLGFTKVTTTDQLCDAFPNLDMVDHKKRRGFVRWETNLQLVVDVLMTNGNPSSPITRVPSPHLPVLASNADLLWMAEAPLPRFGHGSYMFCLENVYKKISGHPLQYTAIVGKPSEITYYHAEYCVSRHAQELGIRKPIKRLYAVGDNPDTDIYGANVYNNYLQTRTLSRLKQIVTQTAVSGGVSSSSSSAWGRNSVEIVADEAEQFYSAESISSILVCTGVYNQEQHQEGQTQQLNHGHRDMIIDPLLKQPKYTVEHVLDAVKLVFDTEQFR
ncbi:unnamed protein product [Didymodactylos carnosus]|uniref:Cat eye syndrome critical region protein 5 n=2 Tax=Didymodactylos carnosus TaxID=1234261 RepID=A0A8S2DNA2_9BILA|nr:unnamed protein product [Didymodactylos carnosus]CAF3761438.1 unnamed protein product [Didymodactylos carnosus]